MKRPFFAAFLGLSFVTSVSATSSAIDQQVDHFFTQGIKHCKNAMELSRSSQDVAAAEFERYQAYISKVEALKPELKGDIMVKRQMEQCDQVGHDVARNEALPVFEQGITVCKEVKSLIGKDHLTKAKAKFSEYKTYRDKALDMTDTVLKIGSNASKTRRCDRLEEKIIAAEARIQSSEIKADRLISALRKSSDSCLVTSRMLENVGNNSEKLDAAEAMLSQAKDYFNQSKSYPDAVARSENYPGYSSSIKIRQYMLEYSRCEQNAVAAIAAQRSHLAALQEQSEQAAVKDTAIAQSKAHPMTVPVVEEIVPKTVLEPVQDMPPPSYSQEVVQISHEVE